MRAVLDTNIVVSGILFPGKPATILRAGIDGRIRLFSSLQLLDELARTLNKPLLQRFITPIGKSVTQIVAEYATVVYLVSCGVVVPVVVADPDDDVLIATAVAASVDVVVTGDRAVLAIGSHHGIDIVSAAEMISRLP